MLIIIFMLSSFADLSLSSSQWILAGLILSTLGDVFLMLRPQKFIAGLASFLVAHIFYVIAFSSKLNSLSIPLVSYWVIPIAVGYFIYLWPKLGEMKLPVLFYFSAISLMLISATALYIQAPTNTHSLLLLGAILFAISDGILGYRKFVKPFMYGQVAVMTTYFSAQCLLALSTFLKF